MTEKESQPVDEGQKSERLDLRIFYLRIQKVLELCYQSSINLGLEEEVDYARKLFFDVRHDEELVPGALKPTDQNNFMFWFLCDYHVKQLDKTYMQHFARGEEAKKLTKELRQAAEQLAKSHLSLYDIVTVDPENEEVTLRELFSLKAVRILDEKISALYNTGMFFGLRIIEIEGNRYSSGDIYVYPGNLKERFLIFLKRQLRDPRAIVPPPLKEMLKKKGYLFNYIQMAVKSTTRYKRPKKVPEKTEEPGKSPKPASKVEVEETSICRSHFMVNDLEKIREILDGLKFTNLKKSSDGRWEYSWFRSPTSLQKGHQDGVIVLTRRKLITHTRGENNHEAVKSYLIKNLKPHANFMYDDLEKRRSFATK